MPDYLCNIEAQRDTILLGEIGALLHMFGKASSEFLQANSLEGGTSDTHQDAKHFPELWSRLERPELTDNFSFTLHGRVEKLKGSFTDFIAKYKGEGRDSLLLQLFNTCHRMTSYDEKGVVRRLQSIDDMWICTSFGHRDRKIDPVRIDSLRIGMDEDLARAFDLYFNRSCTMGDLRETAVRVLKPGLSQALGDTRLPGNDVTLWAQSNGVASLFKPALALLAMGMEPGCTIKDGKLNCNGVRWRLLGVGWNGLRFVECGRKPADILRRQEIISDLSREVQRVVEIEFPLGNLVYQDLNGLFFTFPSVTDDAQTEELVRELATRIIPIVRRHSNDELWPFLTISKPRRTITVIAKEIQVRNGLAALPRVATILSMETEGTLREERLLMGGPALRGPAKGQDVCPVCGFRSKQQTDESCSVCRLRRRNRQLAWQSKRDDQTIWICEVADDHNRMALLTLRLDLSRWLSGEWLTTIYSQTLQEWARGERLDRRIKRLNALVSRGEIQLPGNDAHTIRQSARSFAQWVCKNPGKTECKPLLESFLESGRIDNVEGRLGDVKSVYGLLDEDAILDYFFSQNPSPGRLGRIWRETEEFLWTWLSRVNSNVFSIKPERLGFQTSSVLDGVRAGQTCRIAVPGLVPGEVQVLSLDNGGREMLTVDSLEKFRWERDGVCFKGLPAVQQALGQGGIVSCVDEETGEPLGPGVSPTNPTTIDDKSFKAESYLPYTVLAMSPVFCQVLFPVRRIRPVLQCLLALYNERFEKVQGKLPMHIGLLVAKRKFPLYPLLDAGQMILDHPSFQEGLTLPPWWDTTSLAGDSFFSAYPSEPASNGRHSIAGLPTVSSSKDFWMTPGYFDFDLLGSTADRHRLNYQEGEGRRPVRPSVGHGAICPRPFPLHVL
ncbi:MAG: CRISPR-associated protein Csx11, partial [Peptococcaceae bacterium]|nr:CRISPR-associated protein Csx11 [Peptococcaceae bacterium]